MKDELIRSHETELSASDPLYLSRVVSNRSNPAHEELIVSAERFVLLLELFEPLLHGAKPRQTALAEDEGWHGEKSRSDDHAREQHHQNSCNGRHITL